MIPIGHQPMLMHIMQYYSHYGHRDFVLCLGYKANVIKDHFINLKPSSFSDCVISEFGSKVQLVGAKPAGLAHLADRHGRVAQHRRAAAGREAPGAGRGILPCQLQRWAHRCSAARYGRSPEEERQGRLLPCRAPALQLPSGRFRRHGAVRRMRSSQEAEIWINGGYFVFNRRIFDYIREGEELVLEPFNRLIEAGQLIAYRYEGFWRAMDTLRDKQVLEDMVEKGNMPWRVQADGAG